MSVAKRDLEDNRKVTTHRLIEMKQRGEKISMLTAYDYSMAQLIDQEKFATSMLRKMSVFECSIFKMGDCLMLEIQE